MCLRICGQIKKNNKLDIKNKNVIEKKNLRLDVIIKKKMKKINKKVVTVLIKIFILIKS